jgi:hypothetical protein
MSWNWTDLASIKLNILKQITKVNDSGSPIFFHSNTPVLGKNISISHFFTMTLAHGESSYPQTYWTIFTTSYQLINSCQWTWRRCTTVKHVLRKSSHTGIRQKSLRKNTTNFYYNKLSCTKLWIIWYLLHTTCFPIAIISDYALHSRRNTDFSHYAIDWIKGYILRNSCNF